MEWHPDIPDIPISKPHNIARLEKMDGKSLDSMPSAEIHKLVGDAASSVATTYRKEIQNPNYEDCVEIVSVAMTTTGSAIGGKLGLAMIAEAEDVARKACRIALSDLEDNQS